MYDYIIVSLCIGNKEGHKKHYSRLKQTARDGTNKIKMNYKELETAAEFIKVKSSVLREIVADYIEKVICRVSDEDLESFGIGKVIDSSENGIVYGFKSGVYDEINGTRYLSPVRNGYYFGGDYNLYVPASNDEQIMNFAIELDKHYTAGLAYLIEKSNNMKTVIEMCKSSK